MFCLKLFLATLLLATIAAQQEVATKDHGIVEKAVVWEVIKKFKDTKAFKFLQEYAPAAGDVITVLYKIYGMSQNDTHVEVMNKLDEISTQLDKITESIESLNNRVVSEAAHTNAKITMEKFVIKYSDITKAEHQFEGIIKSYATNETAMLENLLNFLNVQKDAYNEFNIVDYLSVNISTLTTPVDELIKFGRTLEPGSSIPHSSTAKLIYDFHINLLKKVMRSFTIQELALELKFKLSGKRFNEDILFLETRKHEVINELELSIAASLNKLTDDDLKGFIDLNVESNVSHVKFKNVLQTLFAKEEVLSGTDTCTKTCHDYTRVTFDASNCHGEVRSCTHEQTFKDTAINAASHYYWGYSLLLGQAHTKNYYLLQEPNVDRIYEGYNYADKGWYGKGSQSNEKTSHMENGIRDFVDCDVCQCTCDQKNHSLTLRKFYTGIIEAPEGFVVTGVKFAESTEHHAIYLNVQVGILLPMGVVDLSSLHWTGLPEKRQEFVTIDYDNQLSLVLTDTTKFSSKIHVVTGIQLIRTTDVSLKLFGKSLNLTAGTLSGDESEAIDDASRPQLEFGGRPSIKEGSPNFKPNANFNLKFKKSAEVFDAGQSFVPYFDDSEISFDPPSPLSSIGFSHFTNDKDYAGFVIPTIKSIDYNAFKDDL